MKKNRIENCLFGIPLGYINRQSKWSSWGLLRWRQYVVGLGPAGYYAFMKSFISFSLANVKAILVRRVINTLFVLTFGGGTRDKEVILGWGGGVISLLHFDGLPLHLYPGVIVHPMHPVSKVLPVSHCSPPKINPSPQTG